MNNVPLFTPSMVLAEMRTIDGEIKSMIPIVASSATTSAKQSFAVFAKEWVDFRESNSGIVARSLNSTYAKVQEFKRRASEYRSAFERAGLSFPTPKLEEQSTGRWLVIAGAAGVGVLAAIYFARRG